MTYSVYLAGCHLSDHETFEGALDAYRKICLCNGAHVRSPHCDVDFDGFTEDEREALETAHDEAWKARRAK